MPEERNLDDERMEVILWYALTHSEHWFLMQEWCQRQMKALMTIALDDEIEEAKRARARREFGVWSDIAAIKGKYEKAHEALKAADAEETPIGPQEEELVGHGDGDRWHDNRD